MLYVLHTGSENEALRELSGRVDASLIALGADVTDLPAALTKVEDCDSSDTVLFMRYPVESKADIDTVAAFCDWVGANPGNWYYAPRPNEYLPVDRCALVAVRGANLVKSRRRPAAIMRSLYARIPDRAKPVVRRFARPFAIWSLNFFAASAQTQILEPQNPEPQPEASSPEPKMQVPSELQQLGFGFEAWKAPDTMLRRDLIDRSRHFFPHPRGIHVIVLNKCNLKCVMCPYHSPVYKPTHKNDYFDSYRAMSAEVFSKIADYAGKNQIGLQFGQIEEPLMHKGFVGFLREARDKGVPHIHITTNGILLTRENADALVESGLTSLMVSIDAANPETYREIRGGELSEVEDNLRYFISKAKPKGIKTWVSFILQPQADGERDAFLAKWRDLQVDNITFYGLSDHDHETGELIDFKHMYKRETERYPCASPWTQSVVFPNGEVSLCCRTMGLVGWSGVVDVGTLATSPDFETVWDGPQYRTVRAELLANEFEKYKICENCSIWSASTSLTESHNDYTRQYNETMETFSFR